MDDLAGALLFLMRHYSGELHLNVGVGQDLSIRELAEIMSQVVGFQGEIEFDASKPDGTPRKLVDTSRIQALGWQARMPLRKGPEQAYA